jgi:hypothetical protein
MVRCTEIDDRILPGKEPVLVFDSQSHSEPTEKVL